MTVGSKNIRREELKAVENVEKDNE